MFKHIQNYTPNNDNSKIKMQINCTKLYQLSIFHLNYLNFSGFWGTTCDLQNFKFPSQGLNPRPQHWQQRVLTTRPSGKSLKFSGLKQPFLFAHTLGLG